jgi:hypothetical protein
MPRSEQAAPLALSRRRFLSVAAMSAAGIAATSPHPADAARRAQVLYGTGRVSEPIPGVTIPSPSDFGFSVDESGGYFLCSMFGPETGGFQGCDLMTVQGVVAPGTLALARGAANFAGTLDVFVFPNVFVDPPEPYMNAAALSFTVNVVLGGPGQGRLVLSIPAVTEALGGDTGGIIARGRIARRRERRSVS